MSSIRGLEQWYRCDQMLDSARLRLGDPMQQADLRAVGIHCRDALIALADAVYDEARHGAIKNKGNDNERACRRLAKFFEHEVPDESGTLRERLTAAVTAVMNVANGVQHHDTTLRSAMICVEQTQAVRNAVAVLVGQRRPQHIAIERTWGATLTEAHYYKQKAARDEFLAVHYRSIIEGIAAFALDPRRADMHTVETLKELIRAAKRGADDEESWRPLSGRFLVPRPTTNSPQGLGLRP